MKNIDTIAKKYKHFYNASNWFKIKENVRESKGK